jgi:hypothetical protein
VGHAQLAALLLRSPSYKANATAPAQHTLPERFALLISAFKPVAELGSVSDTAMSAVVAKVNELAASMRGNPSGVTGSGAGGRGTGGRGADGRGAGGRGIGGRGRGGRGAELPAAGRGATAPTPFRRTCSVCRQPGHNKSTCPRQEALRGVGAAGDEEPLAVPLPVPTLDGDSGDEALPPVMPLPPALPLPGAPLAAPPPAPSRAQAHPAGGHTASFAHGSGGDVNVALGATALTALLGSALISAWTTLSALVACRCRLQQGWWETHQPCGAKDGRRQRATRAQARAASANAHRGWRVTCYDTP